MKRHRHNEGFSGPFDMIIAFTFYLPNLIVAEMLIRTEGDRGAGRPAILYSALFL